MTSLRGLADRAAGSSTCAGSQQVPLLTLIAGWWRSTEQGCRVCASLRRSYFTWQEGAAEALRAIEAFGIIDFPAGDRAAASWYR